MRHPDDVLLLHRHSLFMVSESERECGCSGVCERDLVLSQSRLEFGVATATALIPFNPDASVSLSSATDCWEAEQADNPMGLSIRIKGGRTRHDEDGYVFQHSEAESSPCLFHKA